MRWVLVIIGLLVACIGGCASVPAASDRQVDKPSLFDVPAPPGIAPAQLQPRIGDARKKAQQPLSAILDSLAFPQDLSTEQTPAPLMGEPPAPAQLFYLDGREAWLHQDTTRAIRQLEKAYHLAPGNVQIVRLLGRIHAGRNWVQALVYLKKAVRLDPADVDSLYLLGEHAAREGLYERAIVLLGRVLTLGDTGHDSDPATWILAQYYLAMALDHAGYDQAAIDHYQVYLKMPQYLARSARFTRQLYYLTHRRSELWMMIGDALHRLNQPQAAHQAYRQALKLSVVDQGALTARFVFTHLRLGNRTAAGQVVIHKLRQSRVNKTSVALLGYLTDRGIDRAKLAGKLQEIYEASDRSPDMAISIAVLLDRPHAAQLLRAHLATRPADSAVFEALIRNRLGQQRSFAQDALTITAATIAAIPAAADRYVAILLNTAAAHQPLLDTLAALDKLQKHQPMMRFIHGQLLVRAGRQDEAITEFATVLESMPHFDAAGLAMAQLRLSAGEYDQADRLLGALEQPDAPRALNLRIRVLSRTGQADKALDLVNTQLVKHPAALMLILQKSRLLMQLQRLPQACNTLEDALLSHRRAEPLYDALFNLYSRHPIADSRRQMVRLRQMVQEYIPQSWLAQLLLAEDQVRSGDHQQSEAVEKLLIDLMSQRPGDYRALDLLLDVYWQTNRRDQADNLIDQKVAAEPRNVALLRTAHAHYALRAQYNQKVSQIIIKLLLTRPASETRAVELGHHYLYLNQPAKALKEVDPLLQGAAQQPVALVTVLRRAMTAMDQVQEAQKRICQIIDRFGAHRADLMFELAMLHEDTGDPQRAEEVMLKVIEQFPDHPMSNNTLGYTWADRGVQLDRAEQMIRTALADEPANAAYRDSLGWVFYKRGQFDEAVRQLTRAVHEELGNHSVILDHLGDALYRSGRHKEAVGQWTVALQLYDCESAKLNRELRGLDVRLQNKLQAVSHDQPPDLAEVTPPAQR